MAGYKYAHSSQLSQSIQHLISIAPLFGPGFLEKASKRLEVEKTLVKPGEELQAGSQESKD